jgi:hypothetical protein
VAKAEGGGVSEQRTIQQNKALHKYYRELAEALNAAGLDMKTVLKPELLRANSRS